MGTPNHENSHLFSYTKTDVSPEPLNPQVTLWGLYHLLGSLAPSGIFVTSRVFVNLRVLCHTLGSLSPSGVFVTL